MSDWRDEAACKGRDPDLFFPEDKHRADECEGALR